MKLELTKYIVVVVVILMLGGCGDAKLAKTAKYRKFLKWLQGLGGHLFGCSVRPIPGAGMGVVADRDMQEGTIVLKSPFKAMIHDGEFTLVPRNFSSTLKDAELCMALFISHEKKKVNSFWKPWLDTLPDDVGLILNFSDDELKELEGSQVGHLGKKEKSHIFLVIDKLLQDLNENKLFPEITREDLVRGASIWRSRAYRVHVPTEVYNSGPQDQTTVGVIAPLADMMNTAVATGDSNALCGYVPSWSSNSFEYDFFCVLTRDVRAGQELLIEYQSDPDKLHNAWFLFRYGFVVRNNPHDCVYLKVPTLSHNTPLDMWRLCNTVRFVDVNPISCLAPGLPPLTALAEELPINKASLYCMNRTKDGNPNILQLIRLMRLLTAESHEIKKSIEAENLFSKPLSIKSEKNALEYAMRYLEDTLQGYPTAIHEDEVILEQKHLSANVRNAVLLRHGEKSVLKENINYVRKKLGDLEFSEHPAKSLEL